MSYSVEDAAVREMIYYMRKISYRTGVKMWSPDRDGISFDECVRLTGESILKEIDRLQHPGMTE